MTNVRFRRASPADAETILSVKRAAIEELEHWQYSPEQVEVWKPKESYADTFEEAIGDDRFVVHVAECDREDGSEATDIVGYGALTVPDERIDAIYVHPDYHGQGIATAMVKHLEVSARFQDIDELDIVAARNAVPFYESVGYWRLDDEVATIEDVDVEFVRMRKDLEETNLDDRFDVTDEERAPDSDEWFDSHAWTDADVDPDDWFDANEDGEDRADQTASEEWFGTTAERTDGGHDTDADEWFDSPAE